MRNSLGIGLCFAVLICGVFAIVPTLSPVKRVNPGLDHCHLPKDVGPCRAVILRYYYNSAAGKCDVFKYGGCGGNANNFATLQECQVFMQRCNRDTRITTTRKPNRRPPGSAGRLPGGTGWSS